MRRLSSQTCEQMLHFSPSRNFCVECSIQSVLEQWFRKQPARGSPMKRGLKLKSLPEPSHITSKPARGSPMKRGLKPVCRDHMARDGAARARLPDEEGTETSC